MEQEQFEKLNDKMLGIITLLSFIDSKLGVIIENTTKIPPYQSVVDKNYYMSVNCASDN